MKPNIIAGSETGSLDSRDKQNPQARPHDKDPPNDFQKISTPETEAREGPLDHPRPGEEAREFSHLLQTVQKSFAIQLSDFCNTNLRKGIAHEMQSRLISSYSAYSSFLAQNPDSLGSLLDRVLGRREQPGVLRLKDLQDACDHILATENHAARIWIVNASMANFLWLALGVYKNCVLQGGKSDLRFFATDVSRQRIDRMANAPLRKEDLTTLPRDWIADCLVSNTEGYTYSRGLRSALVFVHHDLVGAPAFPDVDIAFLDPTIHSFRPKSIRRAITTLTRSLRKRDGKLLGPPELSKHSARLEVEKKAVVSQYRVDQTQPDVEKPAGPSKFRRSVCNQADASPDYFESILKHSPYPMLVFDQNGTVRFRFGKTAALERRLSGAVTFDMDAFLKREIANEVAKLLETAVNSGNTIYASIEEFSSNARHEVTVYPITSGEETLFGFLFYPQEDTATDDLRPVKLNDDFHEKELGPLLREAHEELVSRSEQIESLREQLQTANELLRDVSDNHPG